MPHKTLKTLLVDSRLGETTAVSLAGGSFIMESVGYLTPIMALLGTILAVIAGVYTIRLKRIEFKTRISKLQEIEQRLADQLTERKRLERECAAKAKAAGFDPPCIDDE